jgi:DedD protein
MTHEPPELQRVHGHERDREITLSMGVILSIFFALALICAIFFGMGYSLGRHSSQPQTTADGTPTDSGSFNGFKPSPQSLAVQPAPTSSAPATSASTDTSAAPENTAPAPVIADTSHGIAASTTPVATKPVAVAPQPVPVAASSQPSIVQVAAVSHQEDADVLLSALRKQGYAVNARPDPQDKLIHIQLGPFANRNDANAMRQKLLADGYNAIVK